MNRVSVIIITFQRDSDLKESVESCFRALGDLVGEIIIVDNNNDGCSRHELFSELSNVKIVNPNANLGVAGGRNLGVKHASFPYLLFFDDDAVFDENFELDAFKASIRSGVMLASNTIRSSGNYAREEFPFFNKKRDRNLLQESARFIGVAHLCSKEMFVSFGGYDEKTFYGMEEFYFSAWILANNYVIEYVPSFKVVHKKSEQGREVWTVQSLRMFKNKVGFLREWYSYPFFVILSLINLLFFIRKGMKIQAGVNILVKALASTSAKTVSFKSKMQFLQKQFKIRDYLI